KVIIKSAAIPYPPLAIHPKVDGAVKAKLREAFNNVDKLPGITKDQIRGYGGGKVDGYTANVSEEDMANAGKLFEMVTDPVKQDIMKKASAR
ncbi:MAG: phosphate/phosphite/phosphonate ABC transporter substrate-binding protein, partial [Gammaproteobacteria bacterium]